MQGKASIENSPLKADRGLNLKRIQSDSEMVQKMLSADKKMTLTPLISPNKNTKSAQTFMVSSFYKNPLQYTLKDIGTALRWKTRL